MQPSLPILTLLKSSAWGIASYRKGLILTAVYCVLLTAIMLVALLFATENGAEYLRGRGFTENILNVDVVWSRMAFVGLFLLGVLVLGVGVFNMWVRFAVLGIDEVGFPSVGQAVIAAVINLVKLLAIGILAHVIGMILLLFLYLVSGLEQNQLIDDAIPAVLACCAFAFFADTLVKTALARDVGNIGPKYWERFALLLSLLWALEYMLVLLLLEVMSFFWVSIAFLPFDIISVALTAALFGYRQVWRLRVFVGEDHEEIPVERRNGA